MAGGAFSPGDVVQLKSGGPDMTIVRSVHGDPHTYWCLWFGGGRKRESAEFHGVVLKASPNKNN